MTTGGSLVYLFPDPALYGKSRKEMKACVPIAIAVCLWGCDNEPANPVGNRTPDSTVHLAGSGGYWKNGAYTPLDFFQVNTMSVDGSVVVIAGQASRGHVIWRNGTETVVNDHIGGSAFAVSSASNLFGVWYEQVWVMRRNNLTTPLNLMGWATAMAVDGDDVYTACNTQGDEYEWGVSPFYHLDTYALVWKNDGEFFRETVHSYANTIFIHGDDVYLGGHLNHYPSLDVIACYWKNGERFVLTNENQDAQVRSMFVNDSHVYAAGVLNDEAVYWRDGHVVNLSSSTDDSDAYSISVLGTDVYVAGQEGGRPALWKNGIRRFVGNLEGQRGKFSSVVAIKN